MEADAVLVVDDLSKDYGETLAVDRLSFAVRPGEILGLVGPNGAGKTTTLRSIAGVLPIQSGRVTVCGHDVAREPERAKHELAWVPDDSEPYDALTVAEHLEFTAELYRVDAWRERAELLLERFELSEKRDALGGELSRGMRQKLAFCCAWLHRPSVLLMDEPLSGLDPRGIRAAKAAIRDVAAEGAAVILSSHLLSLIEELGTRLLIVDRGTKLFDGTMEEAREAQRSSDLDGDAEGEGGGGDLEQFFFAHTRDRS